MNPARSLLRSLPLALLLAGTALTPRLSAEPEPRAARLEFDFPAGARKTPDDPLVLRGRDARQQLLVTARLESGAARDFTRQARFTVSPATVVRVDKTGTLTPLADGEATVTAATADGVSTTLAIRVERFGEIQPINFPNQIVPIFTKNGCNGGGCHGKAAGQNGFRLSLLGFEPAEDFEHLVKEARGRRLFPASPENSLLLLKGTATLPHGGGKRLQPDSDDYRLLVRWISQGMPYGKPTDPVVDRIEVAPTDRVLPLNAQQQLSVLAHYSDGSVEDVTRSALYEPNDKMIARTGDTGRVDLQDQPGDVAVMVRYQGKVSVFRATVPLGAPVDNLPEPRNYIDELVFKKLKQIGIPPSALCDDTTFIRRATVDIAGRLPSPEETRRFLADPDPAKRDRLVDRLVDSADYADYFANKWSALLRNKRNDPKQMRGSFAFHAWIRDSFLENKPYDQFVREVVAASGDLAHNPPVAWYRQVRETQAQLEDTAQLFLGLRLQCAQCHHHPFEKWSQQDYYSFAAFFSQVARKPGSQPGEELIFARNSAPAATNKKTRQPVKAAGLGSTPLDLPSDVDARQALAEWLTNPKNPFFAKSLVNRYWKHFFNRGLVDPEDDMRETNPPTNPELLDRLAQEFVRSGYDLKKLVRTIAQSRAYQLSATPNAHNKIDRQHFSRYYPKRLTAEVLYDAVHQVLGAESQFEGLPPGTRAVSLPDNSFNASSYFLSVFGRPESSSACECERSQDASLAQSLHLLNSKEIQARLTADSSRPARLAVDSPRSDDDKVRDLYWLAFSREPDADELTVAKTHLARRIKGPDGKDTPIPARQAYEDIAWALLNTKEFLFNH